VALVTGAGKRIGLRISERLALEGYAVILHCSPSGGAAAETEVAQMKASGGKVASLSLDLTDIMALQRLIEKSKTIFGPLTLLVNNAAIFEGDEACDFDLDRWERHFAVNLRAPAILSRDFARQAPPHANASIVNIIDQRVLRPTPQFFSYSLSKAALWTATVTMAQAFAPRGIRVNAVGPGPVLPNGSQGEAGFNREVAGLPLGRSVDLADIAEAVLYLAKSRSVTGQMIAVDAGQHIAWRTPDIVL
jgi:NAD(P)-dependent dehydrogenase (short-subunit alcohol dehydrogenase family)